MSKIIFHFYCAVFAGSHAFSATYASVLASLASVRTLILVAAHNRCGSTARNHGDNLFRASRFANAATHAKAHVYMRDTVFNADSIMWAFFRAIAKAYAAKFTTCFASIGGVSNGTFFNSCVGG
jgi:hypothetical protein